MSLINATKFEKINLKEETHYIGTVINNNDPLKIGRIKVRIEELFGTSKDIPDDDLPWAIRKSSPTFGGKEGLSSFMVPDLGSRVLVIFLRGSIYSPMYVGRISDKSNKLPDQDVDYPNTYILRDKNGNKIAVNLTQNTISLVFNGDATINVVEKSGKGNVTINVAKNVTIACKNINVSCENANITSTKTATVSATEKIDLTSPKVNMSGDLKVTGSIEGDTVSDSLGDLAQRKAEDTGGSGNWPLIP